ncbi:hypothetical protein QTP70_021929, partial [Hemibagrus guttatus]
MKSGIRDLYAKWKPWLTKMRPECQESRESWHCTMMYDEEGQNEEYEAMWDEHVTRTQYSLKTIDFIVGPQGAAAAKAVQLPKQLEQWYQIPEAAPHVSLLIGQGFESKELGPMVKEASKVKQWTQLNMPPKPRKPTDQAALAPVSASDPATEDAPAENTQDTGNVAILSAISSLRFEIRSIKSDIGDIIDSKIEQLAVAIRGELTAFQQEASSAISAVKITVDEHASKLAGLEANASTSSDTVAKLEQEMGRLKQVVEQLSDKCMDLEGRSRRQNIRILHIKEGAESGMKPRDFIAQLLMETLSLDNLPLVDRAHRALRNRPADDEPPRAFIIRLHYTHEMEEILRKAAKMQQVTFRGQRINIFPDYPPAVVKRRALFKRARELLKDKPGVKYGLQYPAKLRVSYNGKEHYFTDPDKAVKFAENCFGS